MLHLVLTLVTFGLWSNVWIVLAARYWNVRDYRNPAELPGMNRRTTGAVIILVGLGIVTLIATSLLPSSDTPEAAANTGAPARSATGGGAKSAANPERRLSQQEKFVRLIVNGRDKADSADSKFRKRLALTNRDKAICKLLKSKSAKNWTGEITDLDTNGDGLGVLEIEIAEDVKVSTWNNALSDISDNTLIKTSSPVFKQMSSLNEGDRVTFSGRFIRDSESCIGEQSLTDVGSTETPTFTMRFTKLAAS